jgi:hypothetical protein
MVWSMMKLALAKLLYTFDMRMVGDARNFGDEKTYIFWEKRPLNVKLQMRA